MEGTAWDARHEPSPREATRAAQTAGVYDCCRWGGASVKGCPWLFLGDPRGAQGGVRDCEYGPLPGGWTGRQTRLGRGEGDGLS